VQASTATIHNLWIAGVIGAALAAFIWCNAPALIQGFNPTAPVAALAVKHLRVRSLACPAALLLFVANGAFRGARDTKCVLPFLLFALYLTDNLTFQLPAYFVHFLALAVGVHTSSGLPAAYRL